MNETFFGKYRGVVIDNQDPLSIGRIRAHVPDVLGEHESGWAMPCVPFSGKSMGFLGLPDVDAGVWIEFEHGDPEYPLWSGCWWGDSSELPDELQSQQEQKVMIKTKGGLSILLDDTDGITIQTNDGQKIVINVEGITLDNGNGAEIELSGESVTINDDALEVM